MRHLGTQTYKDIVVNNNASINKTSVQDKLNVPFHRPLEGAEFGDLFLENNQLNITNQDNDIIPLLDLNNSDIIKALLLTEQVFDDFYNFDKELVNTGSFNTNITLGTDLQQITVDTTQSASTDQTNNTIIISFSQSTEAEDVFLKLLDFNQYNCPLLTTIYDGTNTISYMVYYNNINYSTGTTEINVVLNSVLNQSVLNDLTNTEINTITIKSFQFTNNEVVDNYVALPKHYHQLKDIDDLTSNTNSTNGYLRLSDSTLSLPFPYTLVIDDVALNNSLLKKDYAKNIQNKLNFDLLLTNQYLEELVNYTDTTVDLGGGDYLIEYTFNDFTVNNTKLIELTTKDGQGITTTKDYSLTDTTAYQNSYLVEVVKFNYGLLISQLNSRVIDVIDVSLQQIDKTAIEDPQLKIYSITDTTITAISCYYDISILQPNATTPPSAIINPVNLFKDDDGYILLSVPKTYTNIVGTKHFSLPSEADLYFTFDNTAFPITLTISSLDLIANDQETYISLTLAQEQQKYVLPRGRYKIESDTPLNKYNIKMFINQ